MALPCNIVARRDATVATAATVPTVATVATVTTVAMLSAVATVANIFITHLIAVPAAVFGGMVGMP
jgi:hypothetical protein